MRFKELTEEVLRIAKRDSVSEMDAARIDSLLANADEQLSAQEQRTLASFFWATATSPVWLTLLREHILNCPPAVVTDKGYQVPIWLAEPYVRTQIKNEQNSVLEILFEIKSNNARFYEVVAQAALTISPEKAKELIPLLIEYANNQYSFTKLKLVPVLSRFATQGLIPDALSLASEVVRFARDPIAQEKLERRRTDPEDWTTSLEPQPKLDHWEYQELLEKGIRVLAKTAPFKTAQLLISAAAEMLQLKSSTDDEKWQDTSEIWAPRVDQPERYETDPKAALVRTLTFSCEQVYEQANGNTAQIERLDSSLREGKWLLFTRLRQHLYSKYPLRAKEWIRNSILEYPDYESWDTTLNFRNWFAAD